MDDTDARIAALFDEAPPPADDGFTRRVLALAALEDRLAERRRVVRRQLVIEAAALAGVLAAFAALAHFSPPADVVPLASPAMAGLIMLGSWLAFGLRGQASSSRSERPRVSRPA